VFPFQVVINGLVTGLLYALLALGFSVIYSGARVFHIAHGAFYTASPYLYLAFAGVLSLLIISPATVLVGSVVLALAFVPLLGYFSERTIYRPLAQKKAPTLVTFISSLGLYIILVNTIALLFGNETKVLNSTLEPSFSLAGAIVTRIQVIQLVTALAMIVGVLVLLRQTSLGRHIRALSDNPVLLNVLGINVKKVRAQVFMLGTLLAGAASLLRAFDVGVDPHVGLSAVLTAAVAVIIGGVGFHLGAVLGALLIGFSQNIVVWYASAQWQEAVTFVVLVTVLLVRREGLFAFQLRAEEQ
jgi:branched-chain amino acid transport system permease protein